MQRCSDAGSVLGAPDGARLGLPARAPPSDPRCRNASQRTLRQIMQSPGAPSQARGCYNSRQFLRQPGAAETASQPAKHLTQEQSMPQPATEPDPLMKSETRDGMRIAWDVPIEMDDGLLLRADVFRPVAEGRYPIIMTHGPYAKGLAFQQGFKSMWDLSLIHISEPTRLGMISYAVFCLKKK